MPTSYSKEERERYHSYLKIHLKKEQRSLSAEKQVIILQKKSRRQWLMLVLNVVIILFFGYSFLDGITQLSNTLFYILVVVFLINLGTILYQKKRINELIAYLKRKREQ